MVTNDKKSQTQDQNKTGSLMWPGFTVASTKCDFFFFDADETESGTFQRMMVAVSMYSALTVYQ